MARLLVSAAGMLLAVGASVSLGGGCSAAGGNEGGSSGFGANASGSAGVGAVGGSAGAGGIGGTGIAAAGGSAGTIVLDSGSDAPQDATLTDGSGNTNDAAIDVVGDVCSDAGYAPGPRVRRCAAPTDNECGGASDVEPSRPNGAHGNGFDDDCDGFVDEGCDCGPGVVGGETKVCWTVSPTQADASGQAVGWCRQNSVGTMRCIAQVSGEFTRYRWDGECRGAQLPFADDVCAPGDYDCDGAEANSRTQDCSCSVAEVECPTQPIVTTPFPPPQNLPFLEGNDWIRGVNPALATNWKWTATGGDCDNILPNPSFQLFRTPNGTQGPLGNRVVVTGTQGTQVAIVQGPGPGVGSRIHPAFALSGDYLVTGEFDLNGRHYSCTVKIQVRRPGIRAELCWTPMPNDVDLHFARLQSNATCNGPGRGWFQTCRTDANADDCYYNPASGCTNFAANPSPWGYAQSPNDYCYGWGSRRTAGAGCDNPRLDFDNISCTPSLRNPGGALAGTGFCGAENINLDNPKNGERFAVAAHAYSLSGPVRPHVNIYCNGARKLSLGYQPGTYDFPVLQTSGADRGGDFWVAATVEAVVSSAGTMTDCIVTPVPSRVPKPALDGSSDLCVDTHPRNGGAPGSDNRQWLFTQGGGYPATAADLCWH